MRKLRGATVFASFLFLLVGVLSPSASADPPQITVGGDGKTASVFDIAQATRQRVYIPQPGIDQDGDALPDRIAIEIIRPAESGPALKVPAIVDPSPYNTTVCRGNESECIGDVDSDGLNDKWPMFYDNYFVPRGYAYVLAEANGTANSTGCPLHGGPGDIAGMRSVVDWLNGRAVGYTTATGVVPVTADWHSGKAAMIGKSYDGTLANGVAATGVQGLTTIVPISAISSWYGYSRSGGIRFNTNYPSTLSSVVTNPFRRALCGPTRDAMNLQDGDDTGDVNPFWEARDYLSQVGQVQAAVLATHGLQDDNVTTDQFADWWAGLAAHGVPRKLWLLRGGHVDPFDSRRAAWVDTLHRWFDHWLLDVPNGIMDEPRVDIEDAKDDWHRYADWPIPRTQQTDVYLQATTATTAGGLGLSAGGDPGPVSFANHSSQTESTLIANPTGSQANRRVFLSPPLVRDLRISGTPRVEIAASLSTTQSNLGAALVDYGPSTPVTRSGDGIANTTTRTCWGEPTRLPGDHDACYLEVTKPTESVGSWRVARGILDSSNRNSLTSPTPVVPGQTTSFGWPLYPQDHVFKAGHQIGIVLVGDYRTFSVPGTPGATITVDATRSKLTLPVLGGYREAVASGAFAPDTTAPAQTLPDDIVVTATGDDGAQVLYALPGVSDNEDPEPTSTCTPRPGATFPIGTTTVTCTARDASGNTSPGTFTVTVTRDPAPTTPEQSGTLPAPPVPIAPTTGAPPLPPAPRSAGRPAATSPTTSATLDTVDRRAPSINGLRITSRSRGPRAAFRLSETSTVTVTLRRRGSKTVVGRVARGLRQGRHRLTLRTPKLRPGRYVLRVRAVDGARNARQITRTLTVRR